MTTKRALNKRGSRRKIGVTSARQWRANQENAKKSTGPRSSKGKAKVGGNALRHGLGVAILKDATWSPQVESLARKIAGPEPSALSLEAAKRIAEAEVDLARVRRYRASLLLKPYEPPPMTAKEASNRRKLAELAEVLRRHSVDMSDVEALLNFGRSRPQSL